MKRAWDCVAGIIGRNWFPLSSLLKAEAEFNVQKMIWQSLSPYLTCLNCLNFLICETTQINNREVCNEERSLQLNLFHWKIGIKQCLTCRVDRMLTKKAHF